MTLPFSLEQFPAQFNDEARNLISELDTDALCQYIIRDIEWCSNVTFDENPELVIKLVKSSIFVQIHEAPSSIGAVGLLFFLSNEFLVKDSYMIKNVKNKELDSYEKIYSEMLRQIHSK